MNSVLLRISILLIWLCSGAANANIFSVTIKEAVYDTNANSLTVTGTVSSAGDAATGVTIDLITNGKSTRLITNYNQLKYVTGTNKPKISAFTWIGEIPSNLQIAKGDTVEVLSNRQSNASAAISIQTRSSIIKANISDMLTDKHNITPLSDIPYGVSTATLKDAAYFAWQEFIALNWPAVAQTGALNDRENADAMKNFGEQAAKAAGAYPALVWETFRHKVEIYPGQGNPHGYTSSPTPNVSDDFGYDDLPKYTYNDTSATITVPTTGYVPWVNLDEASQIGTNQMFTGLGSDQIAPTGPGRLVLFLAKANRKQYQYVASRGWWYQTGNKYSPEEAITQTKAYIASNKTTAPFPASLNGSLKTAKQQIADNELISFAAGTIEVKTAWRLATEAEKAAYKTKGYIAGYHAGMVRYYSQTAVKTSTTPAQFTATDTLGVMLALHIIQKTPSAPHFIFATFEHADNIRRADGTPLEDADGNIVAPVPSTITTSNVTSTPSTIKDGVLTQQTFTPNETTASTYSSNNQSYFINSYQSGLASDNSSQPEIGVNKRRYDIPADVISANKDVHAMIAQANSTASNPWGNYRLTNVQWLPLTKTPGTEFPSTDPAKQATYYLSNSMVETNHILSEFSGRFSGVGNTITDYNQAATGAFDNVYSNGTGHLMGGCMGCHGNQQVGGSDFSFIFASPVKSPDNAVNTYPYLDIFKTKAIKH